MKEKALRIIEDLRNYDELYIIGHNNIDCDSYFSSYLLYKVLNYLVAEINYGGRVTDDKDQRLIKTILLTYLTENTLKFNDYPYSESKIYYCPKPGMKSDYMDYIKHLPMNTYPEVFGLYDNAEIISIF